MEKLIKNEQSEYISAQNAKGLIVSLSNSLDGVEVSLCFSVVRFELIPISFIDYYRVLKNIFVNVQESGATYLDIIVRDDREGISFDFLNNF